MRLKKKPGRPASTDPRDHVIGVRLSSEEHAAIALAAKRDDRSISAWIRAAAIASLPVKK